MGKNNEMIHGFLMVKLKPSSQTTTRLKRRVFPLRRRLNTCEKKTPPLCPPWQIHVKVFGRKFSVFFCKKNVIDFLSCCDVSCTFIQVALFLFDKNFIFQSIVVSFWLTWYMFFLGFKKKRLKLETLSQMDPSNFGFHFFACTLPGIPL